ncbi:MAG: hypothetical protein IT324_21520 [Anaerolineae bacterium]|nr:hypothetical protein [Anaerolineae bacterium]
MATSAVTVRKVENKADFKTFFEFPWKHYKNDPNWIPPLVSMRKKMLDKTKNPAWEYMTGDYFVAWRGDQAVGTIAAFINHRHNECWNEKIGWFGFFESIDDQAVADALLQAAADHVRGLPGGPYTAIRGPANFTLWDECGLVVENFSPPMLLMPYNPPYYQRLIEGSTLGYTKVMDTFCYCLTPEIDKAAGGIDEKFKRVIAKTKDRYKITFRKADIKNLNEDFKLIREIVNTAWEKNWGFVPPTDKEMDHLVKDLRDYFNPDTTFIGFVDGKPAGFLLSVPDMNQVLIKAYPRPDQSEIWTLIKALWHWKIRSKITWQRLALMGVKPEYRMMGIEAALGYQYVTEGLVSKTPNLDAGWILESNNPANTIMKGLNGKLYRRYRFYQKPLA